MRCDRSSEVGKCGETCHSARIDRLSQGLRRSRFRYVGLRTISSPSSADLHPPRTAMPRYDLHCHSTHSDGLLPPAAVVARAAARGVDVLALTDHDEVAGLAEARRRRRGRRHHADLRLRAVGELGRASRVHVVALGDRSGQRRRLTQGLDAIRVGRIDARPPHRRRARRGRNRRRLRGRDEVRDERAAHLAHAFRALSRRSRPRARDEGRVQALS